jgi:hypothetical protein
VALTPESLRIDEPEGQRWELALERLRRGEPVLFGNVASVQVEPDAIKVAAFSRWQSENVTAARAREDLVEAARLIDRLSTSDVRFKEIVRGRKAEYELVDDYGKGSVLICRQDRGGRLEWAAGFPIGK